MKCILCGKYFIKEKKFNNLFEFPEICDECEVLYKPKLHYEVIPLENGEIEYYYLYDDLILNMLQKEYLSKHFKILFNVIKNTKVNILIVVDDFQYKNFKKYFYLLKGFKRICLISLVRYNLEYFIDFA